MNINKMNNNYNSNNNYKKISDLKDKYYQLSKKMEKAKNSFPDMKKKVKNIKDNNNVITQQIKQKKMIYEQLNEELKSLKEEMEKKGKHIIKKNSINSQSSGTSNESRKSKVGKFIKGLFG
jgi:chromosome segregation ATPase